MLSIWFVLSGVQLIRASSLYRWSSPTDWDYILHPSQQWHCKLVANFVLLHDALVHLKVAYVHRKIWASTIACDRQMAFGAPVVPELARIRPMVCWVSSITGGLICWMNITIYSYGIIVRPFFTYINSLSSSSFESMFSMHLNPISFLSIVMISASNSTLFKCDSTTSMATAWQITNLGAILFSSPLSFSLILKY